MLKNRHSKAFVQGGTPDRLAAQHRAIMDHLPKDRLGRRLADLTPEEVAGLEAKMQRYVQDGLIWRTR